MNKTIVFDMDGVLFDTERLCVEVWKKVAKDWGIQGMEDVVMRCIGLNGNDSKNLVLNAYGESFPYEKFRTRVSEVFWEDIEKNGLPIKTGVKKLLPYLQQNGYKIGLCSSTKYDSVVSHLKQAEIIEYFSVIVTGDMVEHSKPQPDIYLLACKKLGAEPGESFAIEDSPNGIRAAAAAGMKPVMVPDLIEPDKEMERLAFLICRDLTEVMRYLNQNAVPSGTVR